MNDILAAQCTVITVFSILFSLWYSNIEEKLNQKIIASRKSDEHLIKEIRMTIKSKIIILLVITIISIIVFMKPIIEIFVNCINYLSQADLSPKDFDSIQAAVVFVYGLCIYFLSICISWLHKARKLIK